MFDGVFQNEAFYTGAKVLGGLVLLGVWWLWYRKFLKRWAAPEEGKARPAFPFPSMLVMIGLTFAFVFAASMEPAFRPVQGVNSDVERQRRQAAEQEDARRKAPEFRPPGITLDERTKQAIDANAKEAQGARDRFQKLPAAESNGTGGMKPRPSDEKGKEKDKK